MNPVERVLRKVDAAQQRHKPTAFVYGVIKKYGDDNGGVLVSNLAYSSFVSLFPLLLVLVTILTYTTAINPSFDTDVRNAVAGQVPLLGQTLIGSVHQRERASIIGLIVGLVGLIWGSTGWLSPACSRWSRCGTCRGPSGQATSSDSGARCSSWPCSAAG